jgi:quercetin dioxygenase-like cupin family protein
MTTRTEMREMHPGSAGEVDRRDFLPPGRERLIETVVLAPREIASAHRHDAGEFAGALKGSIITRVEGGESQTVHAGEGFYESPTDLHLESRNASTAEPATRLVFFVKKIGAPSTTQ